MRLLLDSHPLILALDDPDVLAEAARTEIRDTENDVFVSVASLWELSIKHGVGRLRLPETFLEKIVDSRFETLDIRADHAWAAGALPRHHGDPVDRMLVAQAQLEGLTIVTRDRQIARYQVAILPA